MVLPTVPVLGFAAWSGAGKTSLLKRLIPSLSAGGLEIALIKHAHHSFDIDYPGKDSYELRKAGASQIVVASSERTALIIDKPQKKQGDPALEDMIAHIEKSDCDLILVEGFKYSSMAKMEIYRPSLNKPLLCVNDPEIFAVITDAPDQAPKHLAVVHIDDIEAITSLVLSFMKKWPNP